MSATTDFWAASHISSNFGDIRPGGRKHRGTDYTHGNGTPIPCPLAGTVVGVLAPATWHGFGYQVTVRAASGETYSFAHMQSDSRFGVGSNVAVGDILGLEGRTGATTGPCVHVEYNLSGFSDAAPHIAALISGAPAPAPAPAPAGGGGHPQIKRGSRGAAVVTWQNFLRTNYPAYASNVRGDGDFGGITEGATKEWQRRSGLDVDGVVGPKSWAKSGL